MKWLTLTLIKQQLRIEPDFTMEDDYLESKGRAAEDAILNLLSRNYTQVIETYGEVPASIVDASLMLVSFLYYHREASVTQQLHANPTFEMMLKPYMRLASDSNNNQNTNVYGNHCNL